MSHVCARVRPVAGKWHLRARASELRLLAHEILWLHPHGQTVHACAKLVAIEGIVQ